MVVFFFVPLALLFYLLDLSLTRCFYYPRVTPPSCMLFSAPFLELKLYWSKACANANIYSLKQYIDEIISQLARHWLGVYVNCVDTPAYLGRLIL